MWLFDQGTRVLVAGDLVTLPVPFLDTACPSGWQAALGNLDAIDLALLVPGHGAPLERKQFAVATLARSLVWGSGERFAAHPDPRGGSFTV